MAADYLYEEFLPKNLVEKLLERTSPVDAIKKDKGSHDFDFRILPCSSNAQKGLESPGLCESLESDQALHFVLSLYRFLEADLSKLLFQRKKDRAFLDERVGAIEKFNLDFQPQKPYSVLGLQDSQGRIVFGPLRSNYASSGGAPIAPLPEFLKGPHITLFGPPDNPKMAINAMNAYHRKLPQEPKIVEELLASENISPMWGADDEDSKTPTHEDLVSAGQNLAQCLSGKFEYAEGNKSYRLAGNHLSLPIKRFPGLALPCSFLFYGKQPIPLHLYDFGLHLFHCWNDPKALVFYVPKLENEEEARYIHRMVHYAEAEIKKIHPEYQLGTVRLMIVLENPRAILRTHEIMDELYPYFAGASLGWHDYLASMARISKNNSFYRIPVKADPEIVIKYIKASHRLLADVVGARGGIKVGGMYGILPQVGNEEEYKKSWQITLRGFVKDVITQMKRDLTGFWVAHPDFVRLGIALVIAWKRYISGNKDPLFSLLKGLLESKYYEEVKRFVEGPDVEGLDVNDPDYVNALVVGNIKESDFIPNNHPDEIRYNVFQSLQYLTDWLCGNGCVALPTEVDGIPVRVMDDLATAERSRWEVWHEIAHARFSLAEFIKITHEELAYIRKDGKLALNSTCSPQHQKRIVQVKWNESTAKWYPVAHKVLLKLMTDKNPVEFATELLMPFTVDEIRKSERPWEAAEIVCPGKYTLEPEVDRLHSYFEACGCLSFAKEMAKYPALDFEKVKEKILQFSQEEVIEASGFHGDIGQKKEGLDEQASQEQAKVLADKNEEIRLELVNLGLQYKKKYGFKFLVSAQGKSAKELLAVLKDRMNGDFAQELCSAKWALFEIAKKRLEKSNTRPQLLCGFSQKLEKIRIAHGIDSVNVALIEGDAIQELSSSSGGGLPASSKKKVYQLASLSKSIASAFVLEWFKERNISIDTSVNKLFEESGVEFRLVSTSKEIDPNDVKVKNLLNHTALNMHYVYGFPPSQGLPSIKEYLLGNNPRHEKVSVIFSHGEKFQYSGGGFLVLEYLIECLERAENIRLDKASTSRSAAQIIQPFLKKLGLESVAQAAILSSSLSDSNSRKGEIDNSDLEFLPGYLDSGKKIKEGRLHFPLFAAGMQGTATEVAQFLVALAQGYQRNGDFGESLVPVSHSTSVEMLYGQDLGSMEFMGTRMGLGIFTAEAGPNRLMIHQGANDGFRALFVHCFAGPDFGKGFVILCNGDNNGVPLIGTIARELVQNWNWSGIDFSKWKSEGGDFQIDLDSIAQEQKVNRGYKQLLFDAFQEDLPNQIQKKGPLDPLSSFNLATQAKIVRVSNQKFARAENLISPFLPCFDPDLFERQGKTMDSWETVRHNSKEFDFLEMRWAEKISIRYVQISTQFHDGNHPEYFEIEKWDEKKSEWKEVVKKSLMQGHSLIRIDLQKDTDLAQMRLKIFPDGGVSRLGLFKEVPNALRHDFKPIGQAQWVRFSESIPKSKKPLSIPYDSKEVTNASLRDWASRAYGGRVLRASNEHYGPASQVISPFAPLHMFDGMESARSRKAGHYEEVEIQLGKKIKVRCIQLDFTFFVNNNPKEVSIERAENGGWVTLLPSTYVKPYAGNVFEWIVPDETPLIDVVRVRTYPDGGMNRVRVIGE